MILSAPTEAFQKEKSMTAANFEKIQNRIEAYSVPSGVAVAILIFLVTHNLGSMDSGLWMFISCAVGVGSVCAMTLLGTIFENRHPKMKYRFEWRGVMNSLDGYPITDQDRVLVAERVEERLRSAARYTNMVFAIRDRLRKMASEYLSDSLERVTIEKEIERLEDKADQANNRFFYEWRVLITNLRVLSGKGYENPTTYREALSKK
jgi:hypothetical protein